MRTVTGLYRVLSSAFISELGRLAAGVTTGEALSSPRSRSTIATHLVAASNASLSDVGPHRVAGFKNEASVAALPSERNFPVHTHFPEVAFR